MKFIRISYFAAILLFTNGLAQEVEYRPGSAQFQPVWDLFYKGDHEPELDDPLIGAGKQMTAMICEAIKHKDMRMRRYAIQALGFITDRRAIPTLEAILNDTTEEHGARGSALRSIYQIDQKLGMRHAKRYGGAKQYLGVIVTAILGKEKWLREPSEEH